METEGIRMIARPERSATRSTLVAMATRGRCAQKRVRRAQNFSTPFAPASSFNAHTCGLPPPPPPARPPVWMQDLRLYTVLTVEDATVCNDEKLASGSTAAYAGSAELFLKETIFREGGGGEEPGDERGQGQGGQAWPTVVFAPSNMVDSDEAPNLQISVRVPLVAIGGSGVPVCLSVCLSVYLSICLSVFVIDMGRANLLTTETSVVPCKNACVRACVRVCVCVCVCVLAYVALTALTGWLVNRRRS